MTVTVVPNVKFKRDLAVGMKGDDVLAVKIAVSRMGFWPWREFDNEYNQYFADGRYMSFAHKKFGGVKGLNAYFGFTGNKYTSKTHAALLKARIPRGLPHAGEFAFDAHSLQLYGAAQVDVRSHAEKLVDAIFNWWEWFVAHTEPVHYAQYRPMTQLRMRNNPPKLPMWADCSSCFIYCAFLAGARSPDASYGYSGYGSTYSLVNYGFKISDADLPKYQKDHYIGALYGANEWSTHHISAVKSATQVYSHGNERAPERWAAYRVGWLDFLELRAYPVI